MKNEKKMGVIPSSEYEKERASRASFT